MNNKNEPSSADVTKLIQDLASTDLNVRQAAWQGAAPLGAAAVMPLGDLMASTDKGAARAAKFALENIAHHSAAPGNSSQARAVSTELLKLAGAADRPQPVRAEALHLLGFTADRHSVSDIARLLGDPDVRDEARMALERIPGNESVGAIKKAARTAPPDFRPALEQSIRSRNLTPQTVGKAGAR